METRAAVRASALTCVLGVVVVSMAVGMVSSAWAQQRVVLGSASWAPNGKGFGTAHPRALYNGGDASGSVSQIQWSSWGGHTAFGVGEHPIFKPGGGYYSRPVTARLHAVALGRCYPGGPLAYTRLYVRDPVRPGGPLGKWYLWSGSSTLCHAP